MSEVIVDTEVKRIAVGSQTFPGREWKAAILAFLKSMEGVDKRKTELGRGESFFINFNDHRLFFNISNGIHYYGLDHPMTADRPSLPIIHSKKRHLCLSDKREDVEKALEVFATDDKIKMVVLMRLNISRFFIWKTNDGAIHIESMLTGVM